MVSSSPCSARSSWRWWRTWPSPRSTCKASATAPPPDLATTSSPSANSPSQSLRSALAVDSAWDDHRAMQISDTHTYEASLERVLEMFADEKAIQQRYEGMGHRDVEILECTRTPTSLRIRTSRIVDVEL